ncbi:hypothetical protein QP028_00110 [Corynebacterium suedekumii]|nr:hypothetical protein QP028_00110 [Corynebacterium suedekumii]
MAIAADKQDLVVDGVIGQAISASDNDAAYQLRVLADEVHMPGVPELADPMGRTEWPVAEQAEFAVRIPCIDTSGTTYDAMADIVEWQDYGLGDLPGARFKGGWGPDTDTVYTLRQFGTIPTDDGLFGVALIVHPDDNTHDTAEAMVVDLVAALQERISAAVFPAPARLRTVLSVVLGFRRCGVKVVVTTTRSALPGARATSGDHPTSCPRFTGWIQVNSRTRIIWSVCQTIARSPACRHTGKRVFLVGQPR